ncbi:hypothetical protein I3843_10G065300 [Carya illinoinensis]|nr:hypothetical protein I3843_10G065300 [Carya illinoinensis]
MVAHDGALGKTSRMSGGFYSCLRLGLAAEHGSSSQRLAMTKERLPMVFMRGRKCSVLVHIEQRPSWLMVHALGNAGFFFRKIFLCRLRKKNPVLWSCKGTSR